MPFRPVITFEGGAAFAPQVGASQTLPLYGTGGAETAFYPNYSLQTAPLWDAFIGAEIPLQKEWSYKVGVAYSRISPLAVNGSIQQLISRSDFPFNYHYSVFSRQLLASSNLMFNWHRFHPYLNVGLGVAFNQASGYFATPVSGSEEEPAIAPFVNHEMNSFVYAVGAGVQIDIIQHVRAGVGYQFAGLGASCLGACSDLPGISVLQQNHLYVHEVLAQLSYIF